MKNKVYPKKHPPKFTRLTILALAIILMMSMTACQAKYPITPDVFKGKMEASGYTVFDVSDQFPGSDNEHILKVLMAESNTLHMKFFEINTVDNALVVFNTYKATLESYSNSYSSIDIGNYQKYSVKTSDKQYVIIRIKSTFIYSYCNRADLKTLDNIIKDLGY